MLGTFKPRFKSPAHFRLISLSDEKYKTGSHITLSEYLRLRFSVLKTKTDFCSNNDIIKLAVVCRDVTVISDNGSAGGERDERMGTQKVVAASNGSRII